MVMHRRNRSPLLPWWGKLLIILALLVGVPVGSIWFLGMAATSRWERYAARLRADGTPLTYEEIEAARTSIPDGENAALLLLRYGEATAQKTYAPPDRRVYIFGYSADAPDFFRGLDATAIETSRQFLAIEERAEDLSMLAPLRGMTRGRFDVEVASNPYETFIPELTIARSVAKLIELEALVNIADADVPGAMRSIHMQGVVAGAFDEHPTIIGRLIQLATDARMVHSMEGLVRVHQVDDDALRALSTLIRSRRESATMRWALLGERASWVGICEGLASGDISSRYLQSFASSPDAAENVFLGSPWMPMLLMRGNQIRGAEFHTRLIEAADDPIRLIAAAKQIDVEMSQAGATDVLLRNFMPSLLRAAVLHVKAMARLRCASVALAAERFRLATGRFPQQLDELVPEYMAELPVDPFNGEPLRLIATDQGITIYSVDENGLDEEGQVAADEHTARPADVGFRLVLPEHRGLVILEPSPEDE